MPGKTVFFCAARQDITLQNRLKLLRESETRYHSQSLRLSEGIVLNDKDGAIIAE
jgi:hypothetical protein